jgi:predicted HTH domain antitoxin
MYICRKNLQKKMKSIVLNIPETDNLISFDYSIYLAAKLYEDSLLSTGEAAELTGLSKRAFIEIMGKYGVSVFSTNFEDLKNDIKNA